MGLGYDGAVGVLVERIEEQAQELVRVLRVGAVKRNAFAIASELSRGLPAACGSEGPRSGGPL